MTNDDAWPEGHAEFVAYCDAHPEATTDLTPFGWFLAGLSVGREQVLHAVTDAAMLAALNRASGIFSAHMDDRKVDEG